MDIRTLHNPSKSTNRKECKHLFIIYGEIGKQTNHRDTTVLVRDHILWYTALICLAYDGSIYTKRIQLIVNLIHHRGQLKVTFPGDITWKVDESRRYDSLYWLALFGPFTKRPFAEKRQFHFQHWHPGSETTLRKCEPVWRYPTKFLSKTGHMFSTFLLCSKDSLESFVHIVFCTNHPVFIFTPKSAV